MTTTRLLALMSAHTEGPWFLELTDTTLWVGPKKAHSDKVSEVVTFINAGPEYRQEYRAKADDAPDYRGRTGWGR